MSREYIQSIFNQNFSMSSYSQTGVSFFSSDLSCVSDFVRSGWKYHKFSETYRLVPPRVTLADLVDYQKIWQYKSATFNYLFFLFLKATISSGLLDSWIIHIINSNRCFYHTFSFRLVTGPALEAEIILTGSDDRIYKLKNEIITEYKKYYSLRLNSITTDMQAPDLRFYPSFSPDVEAFFREIKEERKLLGEDPSLGGCGYTIQNIETLPCCDVILLIANGGLKFLFDFVDSENLNKIMLLEYHHWISELMGKMESNYFGISSHTKKFGNKSVIIVDSVYSGKTLLEVAELVRHRGGFPITLGLNPKSRVAISCCDYVLVAGRIYSSSNMDMNDSHLFETMYNVILNENME